MKKLFLSITMIICSVVAAMAAANTAQFIAYVADANDATCMDQSIYLENASYTPAFVNKQDATKMSRVEGKPYVYTLVDDKVCGATATNDLNGTFIVVCTMTATQYVFSFSNVAGRQLYLKDHVTNIFTPITLTDTYAFSAAANSIISDRFEITDEAPEPVFSHDREVASGNWGTICYPELIDSVQGAEVYEIAGRNADASQIAVVPVAVADMVKGKPYLFNATADAQKFFYNPESVVEAPIDGACSLMGTFEQGTLGTDGFYVVKGQSFIPALGTSAVLANRAYLALTNISEMSEYVPQSQSSVAVRFFSVGRGSTTDDMQLKAADQMSGKYIQNGHFVIMKEGKMYNALGF